MTIPNLYIIAGPNGAGKTTASFTVLPDMLGCREFVNADEIARGLSPFNSEAVATQARSIMLARIQELLRAKSDFAIETVLATKNHVNLVHDAQARGYRVVLVFFWLNKPELAAERVEMRALKGGPHIPREVIFRRYQRGIERLVRSFIDIMDEWYVYDTSAGPAEKIASGCLGKKPEIYSYEKWQKLQKIAYGTANR